MLHLRNMGDAASPFWGCRLERKPRFGQTIGSFSKEFTRSRRVDRESELSVSPNAVVGDSPSLEVCIQRFK